MTNIANFAVPSRPSRLIAGFLAAVVFASSQSAAWAEASFWEDRQNAAARQAPEPRSFYARLPQEIALPPVTAAPVMTLPSTGDIPDFPRLAPALPGPALAGSAWAQPALTPYADLRRVSNGSADQPRVFLIEDAHDVFGAQLNVSKLLERLSAASPLVVGVEGVDGPFDLEDHRAFDTDEQRAAVLEKLLKKGYINGPEHFALSASAAPELWGVEDPALYMANVEAYRASLPLRPALLTALERLKTAAGGLKARHFSPELLDLDRTFRSSREDGIKPIALARALALYGFKPTGGSEIQKLLNAKAREEKIDFGAVERERRLFITRLTPTLGEKESRGLLGAAAALRAGLMTPAAFYSGLGELAQRRGLPLSSYPAFRDYIHYTLDADTIRADALFEELDAAEAQAYAAMAHTPEAKLLAGLTADLALLAPLAAHGVTTLEWHRYEARRGSIQRLPETLRALGANAAARDAEAILPSLRVFEAFYTAALARNAAMLDSLLERAKTLKMGSAALVTGGFHTPGLEALLKSRRISFATLSPRFTDVPEEGLDSLAAFAGTRTPLEKMLLGERLFLNTPSSLSAGVQRPGHPFFATAVSMSRMQLTLNVLWGMANGTDVKARVAGFNQRLARFGKASFELFAPAAGELTFAGVPRAGAGAGPAKLYVAVETPENPAAAALKREVPNLVVGDQEKLGDTAYVLGARGINWLERLLPEAVGGAMLVYLTGVTALGMPSLVAITPLLMIVGGSIVRAVFYVFQLWHGFSHAMAVEVFNGRSVAASLSEYAAKLPLRGLLPFQKMFFPGVSRAADAPALSADGLAPWQKRFAAIAGPLGSFFALAGLALVSAVAGDLVDAKVQWGLTLAMGTNLWIILTSWSDYKTFFTGVGNFFFCGIFSGNSPAHPALGGKPQPILPQEARRPMGYALNVTSDRGTQTGGIAIMMKGPDGLFRILVIRAEQTKRGGLDIPLNVLIDTEVKKYEALGYTGFEVHNIDGHTRYATSIGTPDADNAHPHEGAPDRIESLLYLAAGASNDGAPWELPPSGLQPVLQTMDVNVKHVSTHNGDSNAVAAVKGTKLGQKRDIVLSNAEDGALSEKLFGAPIIAQGDSPKLPFQLDRFHTQASIYASGRLALLNIGVAVSAELGLLNGEAEENAKRVIADAPTPEITALVAEAADRVFKQNLGAWPVKDPLTGQLAHTLEDVFVYGGADARAVRGQFPELEAVVPLAVGSPMEQLAQSLERTMLPVLQTHVPGFEKLSAAKKQEMANLFAHWTMNYYFLNNFHRAAIHIVDRAAQGSTFGLSFLSTRDPKAMVWGAYHQPMYLWANREFKSVMGGSESNAFKGAIDNDIEKMPLRLTLANGEVAYRNGNRLVIYNTITRGPPLEFDLSDPAAVAKSERWLDITQSPFVSQMVNNAPADRTQKDFNEIPAATARVRDDVRNPKSYNALTMTHLVGKMLEAVARNKAGKGSGHYDLLFIGTEKSRDLGLAMARMIAAVVGQNVLRIAVVDAATYRSHAREYPVNKNTTVLGISHSGLTANTSFTMEALSERTENLFLISGGVDNIISENILKQKLGKKDKFLARNLITFPGANSWFPAEAATVTVAAGEALAKEVGRALAIGLARQFPKDKAWAQQDFSGSRADVVTAIDAMIDHREVVTKAIVGVDALGNTVESIAIQPDGKRIPNTIGSGLKEISHKLAEHQLESPKAWAATLSHLMLTLMLGVTIPGALLSWIPDNLFMVTSLNLPAIGGLAAASGFWLYSAVYKGNFTGKTLKFTAAVVLVAAGLFFGQVASFGWEYLFTGGFLPIGPNALSFGLPFAVNVSPAMFLNTALYMFFGWVFLVAFLRPWEGRDALARTGPRKVFIADSADNSNRSAAVFRRMLGLAYGIASWGAVQHTTMERVVHDHGAETVRGAIAILGTGRRPADVADTVKSALHLRGVQNGLRPNPFKAKLGKIGPYRFMGITFGPYNAGRLTKSRAFMSGPEIISINFDKKPNPAYHRSVSLTYEGEPDLTGGSAYLETLREIFSDSPLRLIAMQRLAQESGREVANFTPIKFDQGRSQNQTGFATTAQPGEPMDADDISRLYWPELGDKPPKAKKETAASVPTAAPRTTKKDLVLLAQALKIEGADSMKMGPLMAALRQALAGAEPVFLPLQNQAALFRVLASRGGAPVAVIFGREKPVSLAAARRQLHGSRAAPAAWRVDWDGQGFLLTAAAMPATAAPSAPAAARKIELKPLTAAATAEAGAKPPTMEDLLAPHTIKADPVFARFMRGVSRTALTLAVVVMTGMISSSSGVTNHPALEKASEILAPIQTHQIANRDAKVKAPAAPAPLRLGPSDLHGVSSTLRNGTAVKVLSVQPVNGYVMVQTKPGATGWLHSSFIAEPRAADGTPAAAPKATPPANSGAAPAASPATGATPNPDARWSFSWSTFFEWKSLPFKLGTISIDAAAAAKPVATAKLRDAVTPATPLIGQGLLTPENPQWARVYLQPKPGMGGVPLALIHKGTEFTVIAKKGNWYQVEVSGGEGVWRVHRTPERDRKFYTQPEMKFSGWISAPSVTIVKPAPPAVMPKEKETAPITAGGAAKETRTIDAMADAALDFSGQRFETSDGILLALLGGLGTLLVYRRRSAAAVEGTGARLKRAQLQGQAPQPQAVTPEDAALIGAFGQVTTGETAKEKADGAIASALALGSVLGRHPELTKEQRATLHAVAMGAIQRALGGKLGWGQARTLGALIRRAENAPATSASEADSVPIVNLTNDAPDEAVLRQWAMALARPESAPAPIALIDRPGTQSLMASAMKTWLRDHPEMAVTPEALARTRWVALESAGRPTARRAKDGTIETVLLRGVLESAGVPIDPGLSIDILAGRGDAIQWDRDGLPNEVVVNLVLSTLAGVVFRAPLDQMGDALRAARKRLTSA